MKPAAFNYHRPGSVDEALAMRAAAGEGARFIAGGQSLVPMMALRLAAPSDLIDLNTVDQLSGISHSADHIRIGAMTRQEDLVADDGLCAQVPALPAVVASVGHPGTRTRGTIGGSLCHADPAAELPALLLALDADLVVASSGGVTRRLGVEDVFAGHFETTLADDEILTEIHLPVVSGRRMGFHEVTVRSADFADAGAIVSIAAGEGDGGGDPGSIRVVVFALGDRPLRLREVEAAVGAADGDPAAIGAAARLTEQLVSPSHDPPLSAAYRRRLGVTVVRRALEGALGAGQ